MKIGLGSVQFGCDYGISNASGRTPADEVARILSAARAAGIDTIDTAPLYGGSESALGLAGVSGFRIVTKTVKRDPGLSDAENEARLRAAFAASLEKMRIASCHALMFHEARDLLSPCGPRLWSAAMELAGRGLAERVGVSVYDPASLELVLDKFEVGIVQVPVNILDQRFLPMLPELKARGVEVHSRSAFLQGLLLMGEPPAYFDRVRKILDSIPEPRLASALSFLKGCEGIDRIVVGVCSERELSEIVSMYGAVAPQADWSAFRVDDESVINPSAWDFKR